MQWVNVVEYNEDAETDTDTDTTSDPYVAPAC